MSPSGGSQRHKHRFRWIPVDLELFALNAMFSIVLATLSMFFLSSAPLMVAGVYGFIVPGLLGSTWLGRALRESESYEILIDRYADESSSKQLLDWLIPDFKKDDTAGRYVLTRPYVTSFCGTMTAFSFSLRSYAIVVLGLGMFFGWYCFVLGFFSKKPPGDSVGGSQKGPS